MKAHGPMNMAELDFGRHHESNIAATNKDFARQERMRTGRTGVHPDLRDDPMINYFFNSNPHYRRGTNIKANRKIAEKYGVPEEEVREGVIELDQKAKQSSEKFGALFNEFLHDLARRGNGGKDLIGSMLSLHLNRSQQNLKSNLRKNLRLRSNHSQPKRNPANAFPWTTFGAEGNRSLLLLLNQPLLHHQGSLKRRPLQ